MATNNRVLPALSLRANICWASAGQTVYAVCQWGILVALAKMASTELVGYFAIALAITAPVYALFDFQLRHLLSTDMEDRYNFEEYFKLRLITTMLTLLIILGIVLCFNYKLEFSLIILAVGAKKGIEFISDMFYGLFQKQERMDQVAKSLFIKGPLSVLLFCPAIYFTRSLLCGALALVFAWAIVLLGYDIRQGIITLNLVKKSDISKVTFARICRISLRRLELKKVIELSILSLPLGITGVLVSLQINIPLYLIERNLGVSMLGIFAAIAYFERAGKIIMHALGHSSTPKLAKCFMPNTTSTFSLLILKLVSVGALLGVLGVFLAYYAGEFILPFFYKQEYNQKDIFVILMIGASFSYISTFLIYGLIACRYIRAQMYLYLLVIVVLIVCCLKLIPNYGLFGAAAAVVISKFVEVAGATTAILHAIFSQIGKKRKLRNYSLFCSNEEMANPDLRKI